MFSKARILLVFQIKENGVLKFNLVYKTFVLTSGITGKNRTIGTPFCLAQTVYFQKINDLS